MKKLLTLFLCVALLAALLTGCQKTPLVPNSGDDTTDDSIGTDETITEVKDPLEDVLNDLISNRQPTVDKLAWNALEKPEELASIRLDAYTTVDGMRQPMKLTCTDRAAVEELAALLSQIELQEVGTRWYKENKPHTSVTNPWSSISTPIKAPSPLPNDQAIPRKSLVVTSLDGDLTLRISVYNENLIRINGTYEGEFFTVSKEASEQSIPAVNTLLDRFYELLNVAPQTLC